MADRNLDEYQPKRFYTQNTKVRENGFAKFEKDGAYYFALYQDGDIVMLSQSYKGIAGRDNGIESVKKNRRITKRYRFDERTGAKHGFGLYAGNGQEIAISANLNSRGEAERVAGRLNGSVKTASKSAVAKVAASKPKPAIKKSAPKKIVKAPQTRAANNEDNYKRLSFYERQTKGRQNGIESFKGDDGQYYFAHFENGKIRLISESYPTPTARDTGAASVEKNIKLEKRYDYRGPLKNGKHEYRLKAGNGKEIARSIWYGSAATAATGAAYLIGARKRTKPRAKIAKAAPAVAATALAKTTARPKAVKPKANPKTAPKAKHKTTPKVAPKSRVVKAAPIIAAAAIAPKIVKSTPKPVVRKVVPPKPVAPTPPPVAKPAIPVAAVAAAAAVPVMAARAAAPAVAAKVAAPAAAVPVATAATTGGGFGFLRWLIPLLLALLAAIFLFKFCKPTPKPIVLPLVSCWDGTEADSRAECPVKVSCWDGSNAKDALSCPVKPKKVQPIKKVTCWDGLEADTLSSCAVKPAPKPVVEPTPKPVTTYAQPTSGNISRICGPSSNVLFDVPNYSPKTVTYLGSNPQYGNSHGLTTAQFYDKLLAAHFSGGMDQAFLNMMARSVGYENFRDMSAADFSEDTLANGSKGLLGLGSSHMLQYSKIQTDDPAHLEAFRLSGPNGTTLHIMKSCGNYMYVCN